MSYSYLYGFVQSADVFRAVAQIDQLSDAGAPNASLIKWQMPESQRSVFNTTRYLTRMTTQLVGAQQRLELISIGPDGHLIHARPDGFEETTVAPAGSGPDVHGVIRDMQTIGASVYAVGMSRQVYRRSVEGTWQRHDHGTLQNPNDMEIVGFNAIHGLNEDELFAVGFNGEAWRCRQGRWEQLPTPTTQVLNSVQVLADGRVIAAGKNGVLMVFNHGEWTLQKTGLRDEILDVQAFANDIYVATQRALYRLTEGKSLEIIDMGLGAGITCGQLHAAHGTLLSTGRRHQCWSPDGSTWHDIT